MFRGSKDLVFLSVKKIPSRLLGTWFGNIYLRYYLCVHLRGSHWSCDDSSVGLIITNKFFAIVYVST